MPKDLMIKVHAIKPNRRHVHTHLLIIKKKGDEINTTIQKEKK